MNNWPHQSDVDGYYGNPRGKDGNANPEWVRENIIQIPTPWKLFTAWDLSIVNGISIHRKCANSLTAVLQAIWTAAGRDQSKINEWGMSLYAGGYNFKLMRGSSRLSMHSWGCAVDFDSARNSFGDTTPNFADIPAVLKAFSDEGWIWGGKWKTPDGMHWQAAIV